MRTPRSGVSPAEARPGVAAAAFRPAARGYFVPRGANTSTDRVTVRDSSGSSAPTPTTLRATSSPRSLRIDTTTEYSHESAPLGLRNAPSTRSAEKVGCTRRSTSELGSKRGWWWQPGQTLALSRIVVLQCGQILVLPGTATRPFMCSSVLGLLVPAEFRLAAHAGTRRDGEGAGLQLAIEHAGLQQFD